MSKKENIVAFLKRNAFYLILALVLTVIAIVGAVVIINQNKTTPAFKKNSSSTSVSQSVSDSTSISSSVSSGTQTPSDSQNSSVQTPTVITFTMPVEGGVITKEYTDNTVVFNPTLGVYSAHLAIDISGVEGAKVFCAYDGNIESIETYYLLGTVITIDHGNGLKTVYSSLEVNEDLQVGKNLTAGEELGIISTTNRQEYKEGAHLHFETLKDGVKVDPTDYLVMDDDK